MIILFKSNDIKTKVLNLFNEIGIDIKQKIESDNGAIEIAKILNKNFADCTHLVVKECRKEDIYGVSQSGSFFYQPSIGVYENYGEFENIGSNIFMIKCKLADIKENYDIFISND